jgi:hypothetical protein
MADTGNGATLTRSGYTVDIVSIEIGEQTIDTIDISLLSTTGYMEKIAADLADAGTFTVTLRVDAADADVAIGGSAVSSVITWPLQAGETTAANLTGTAIFTGKGSVTFSNNELQERTDTFTWDGVTGPTFTAAS